MYLNRIELHGFKSFADRTQVHFDPGITAIVGPNGCGKSNIIDAVRWVLGEQRARLLRSDKMESVIFNGTRTRRALGMAEVSLTIQNTRGVLPTEYSEVTIGRRLYRSGESDYLLNGTSCRLKDILDLFMDTGMGAGAYSVIELKMIEDLLSDSPQDRRRLFEEAAGITKYKLRRAQALRRLDQTQADLDRLRDLTEEIDRNVRSLSRQAKKAERHRELADRLKMLELSLAATDHHRLASEQQQVEQAVREHEQQLAERSARLQLAEAEVEQRRVHQIEQEKTLGEAQRALDQHQAQVRNAETEARLAAGRLAAAEAALERLQREAEADIERRSQAMADAERHAASLAVAEAEQTRAEEEESRLAEALRAVEIEASLAREELTRAESVGQQAARSLREAERELETMRSRQTVLASEREQVEALISRAGSSTGDLEEQADEAARDLEQAHVRREEADQHLAALQQQRVDLDARLEDVRARLSEARRRFDAHRAEAEVLGSLIDSYEGFSDAVQTLLSESDWTKEPRTVADLLTCPAPMRRAVDVALGVYSDCLVVNSREEAQAGIRRLRSQDAGRATFLILDRLPERGPSVLSPTPPGCTPLSALVSVEQPEHQRLVRVLLANHFLAESLEAALSLQDAYPLARLVTEQGEWVSAGSLRAGGEEKTASFERIGRRDQYDAARAAAEEAGRDVRELETEEAQLHRERNALEIDGARIRLREAERKLADAGRQADQARLAREAEERRSKDLAERLVVLDRAIAEASQTGVLETAAETARAALAQAEAAIAVAYEEAEARSSAHREVMGQHGEARVATSVTRNRTEGLRRDRERAEQSIAELEARGAERQRERERIEEAREAATATEAEHTGQATNLKDGLEELQQRVQNAENELLDMRSAISDSEALLRELRRLREESRDAQAAAQLRLTELQTRLEAVSERLWSEYGLTVAELTAPDPDFDPAVARTEIPSVREQIRNLGAVNELALESYEEEKERLDFLRSQQADLEQAENSLRSTIREINTTARERFEETFSAVREAFQQLFADLFGEDATADISLVGDDPLEDDILIRARPKGKKPSAITQLSGGEKTLTAIALLFAIYLVKPSPFCILDEVDAPLDDANIERFMRMIRSFSESTQFILVTHNKLTMEAADRMYGVTMQEQGVSKLVGVRFSQVLPEAA